MEDQTFGKKPPKPDDGKDGKEDRHVHEFLGSTRLAEEGEDRHNHRFAGVTGEAVPIAGGRHVHRFDTRTDFLDHFHTIEGTTGPDIEVGEGKHVHFAMATTSFVDGHKHNLIFATLIEDPLT